MGKATPGGLNCNASPCQLHSPSRPLRRFTGGLFLGLYHSSTLDLVMNPLAHPNARGRPTATAGMRGMA